MKRSYGILYLVALLALASCNDDKGSPSSQKQAVTTTGGATTGGVPQPATTYTVTFETNGGTAVASATVEQGKTLAVPPPPTLQSFGFGGWYTHKDAKEDKDEFKFDKPIVGNLTLYARWSSSFYTITFDVGGGTPIADLQVEQNKSVPFPPPQKKDDVFDLAFDSWYTDPGLTKPFSPSAPITGDITLYVTYRTDTYLISTEEQLRAVGASPKNLKRSYRLQNDIALNEARSWSPIGVLVYEFNEQIADDKSQRITNPKSMPFSGILDGDGHVVKGLYINNSSQAGVGLVAYNTGTIKNIGVELSARGVNGSSILGVLAGYNSGTVQGYVKGGKVTAPSGDMVGGLVGLNRSVDGYTNAKVYGYTDGVSVNGINEVGGLVGAGIYGEVYGYVSGATLTAANRLGGLVGKTTFGVVYGYFVNGTLSGGITLSAYPNALFGGWDIGGLVGSSSGYVYGYAQGKLIGSGNAGGLIGGGGNEVMGYTRMEVARNTLKASPNDPFELSFGLLTGAIPAKGYHSGKAGESALGGFHTGEKTTGIDGDPITVNTNTQQSAFSHLNFGTNPGQWQFTAGRWPAIWLPAEVGGNYKAQDQPTAP